MFVTVTYLRLNHWWNYFSLTVWGLKITLQAKKQRGFIELKNTGFGYLHFTLSAWENETAARDFARTGAHREALKRSAKIATEIGVYTFRSEQLPDWKAAKKLVFEKGRIISFGENLKR